MTLRDEAGARSGRAARAAGAWKRDGTRWCGGEKYGDGATDGRAERVFWFLSRVGGRAHKKHKRAIRDVRAPPPTPIPPIHTGAKSPPPAKAQASARPRLALAGHSFRPPRSGKMRRFGLLAAAAAACLLAADAVDRSKFRTCHDAGFCRRHRETKEEPEVRGGAALSPP
jgi:hypothetical protein